MAYFNSVDISASFKIFRQKFHLLVFVIIKSAMLLRLTNPSKWSTSNVKLVPEKNFKMIAPTVFPVGVSTNWLNFLLTFAHNFLNFTTNRTKFCGDVGLCSTTCAPNFVEIGAQEHSLRTLLLFGAKKNKIRRKCDKFQGLVSQELLGLFLSNLICKVLYMVKIKYVDLVEISTMVFEL